MSQEVPLITVEIVHEEQNGTHAQMNAIINKLPKSIPTAHIVSSRGCTDKEDNTHFDSAGLRELGRRCAKKMKGVENNK